MKPQQRHYRKNKQTSPVEVAKSHEQAKEIAKEKRNEHKVAAVKEKKKKDLEEKKTDKQAQEIARQKRNEHKEAEGETEEENDVEKVLAMIPTEKYNITLGGLDDNDDNDDNDESEDDDFGIPPHSSTHQDPISKKIPFNTPKKTLQIVNPVITNKKNNDKDEESAEDGDSDDEEGEENASKGETLQEKAALDKKPVKYEAPNHSCVLKWMRGSVFVRIVLHKIPPHLINFDPTSTHFKLDTFRCSKKYCLDFPYPHNIKVEPTKSDAKFESGVLEVYLPIADWGDKTAERIEWLRGQEEKKKNKRKLPQKPGDKKKQKRNKKNTGKGQKERQAEKAKPIEIVPEDVAVPELINPKKRKQQPEAKENKKAETKQNKEKKQKTTEEPMKETKKKIKKRNLPSPKTH